MPADLPYRMVIAVALTFLKLMGWQMRPSGEEHIPLEGPAVLASNHVGFGDFVFIGLAGLHRRRLTRFMAEKAAFDHWFSGPLLCSMHHIPVDRFGPNPESAIESALEALRQGEVVGIHPEGGINRSFVPGEGKTGAARIAMAARAPLLPVAVWGSHRILTVGHTKGLWQRNIVVLVKIGAPIPYEPDEDPVDVTDRLMARIRELTAQAVQEYPQKPRGQNDRWWVPAHLGGTAPTEEESKRMTEAFRARRRAQDAWRRLRKRHRPGSPPHPPGTVGPA